MLHAMKVESHILLKPLYCNLFFSFKILYDVLWGVNLWVVYNIRSIINICTMKHNLDTEGSYC